MIEKVARALFECSEFYHAELEGPTQDLLWKKMEHRFTILARAAIRAIQETVPSEIITNSKTGDLYRCSRCKKIDEVLESF